MLFSWVTSKYLTQLTLSKHNLFWMDLVRDGSWRISVSRTTSASIFTKFLTRSGLEQCYEESTHLRRYSQMLRVHQPSSADCLLFRIDLLPRATEAVCSVKMCGTTAVLHMSHLNPLLHITCTLLLQSPLYHLPLACPSPTAKNEWCQWLVKITLEAASLGNARRWNRTLVACLQNWSNTKHVAAPCVTGQPYSGKHWSSQSGIIRTPCLPKIAPSSSR